MFIQLVLPAAIALAVTTGCQPSPVQREPGLNVLLITIDTLRADALGSYGNPTVSTPWLDRLSNGGVRFSRALASSRRLRSRRPLLIYRRSRKMPPGLRDTTSSPRQRFSTWSRTRGCARC
jgi:hypothetical protein